MPRMETETINERLQFVQDALRDRCTMTDECARYGISRRVFAAWGSLLHGVFAAWGLCYMGLCFMGSLLHGVFPSWVFASWGQSP